jgi:beta-galactosidase/beta-glucuronidase
MTAGHLYPRPQLERDTWVNLNGPWEFALDPEGRWTQPAQVAWATTIEVPFSPETAASGVGDTGFFNTCWYRRSVELPALDAGERLILHFGAVDYAASVWVNEQLVARHEGGFTPFSADISDALHAEGPQTIVVCATDDPHDLAKPRGKQDWLLEPHSIWYPRTTGIWQTVWCERLPATAIGKLRWTPNLTGWAIILHMSLDGQQREGLRLRVRLQVGEQLLAEDTYAVMAGEVHRTITLSDPGIDDYRNELLWSPQQPTLIRAHLQLWAGRGELLDEVRSYTALRQVTVQGDRFLLNGRPYTLRLVLDQGYWNESGLTAPDDAALRRDVELAKAMGFNGVRKHQKIEDPRYLYYADQLGLLVWAEMPSAYRFTRHSIERVTREWMAVIERDCSHPCIVAWVPFNESWGVPDLPDNPEQRHYVQALYHLTRTLDPTRPVIGNDGWESVATDIIGIHDYASDPALLAQRYRSEEVVGQLFARERPGGRVLTVDGQPYAGQPIMLSEFGGIAYSADTEQTWGYTRSSDATAFAQQYAKLLETVRGLKLFAGFCYTQFADTYQEANGLLYADRTPKIPLEEIYAATRGPRSPRELQIEREWRARMLKFQQEQKVGFDDEAVDMT